MPIKYCKVAKIRESKIRAMNSSVTPFGNKSVDDVFFFDIFRVKMLLLLSKACALNEHRQKETNLEMLVENARFQRNAQPFLGFLILPRVF